MNTTDIFATDGYPAGVSRVGDIYNGHSLNPLIFSKPRILIVQIFDWKLMRGEQSGDIPRPTLQEMKSMCWQYILSGVSGLLFYSLRLYFNLDE